MTSDNWPVSAAIAVLYLMMSGFTILLYAIDKSAARQRKSRISERTLLLCGLACGWPGAIMAQQIFRHKTQKLSFRILFFFTVLINLLILALVFWMRLI
ncbi:DUF1294 domain-containing protein [Undibacterium sp. TJN19]|uniref:DUF1294 domain-containing protein n=1 Tax=Undibacterium sp. TJN19 TaxID=3413055 RepID=UPI003BF04FB4